MMMKNTFSVKSLGKFVFNKGQGSDHIITQHYYGLFVCNDHQPQTVVMPDIYLSAQ